MTRGRSGRSPGFSGGLTRQRFTLPEGIPQPSTQVSQPLGPAGRHRPAPEGLPLGERPGFLLALLDEPFDRVVVLHETRPSRRTAISLPHGVEGDDYRSHSEGVTWVTALELTSEPADRYHKTRSMEPTWRKAAGGAWEFAKTLIIAFLLAQLIMVSVAQAFQVEQYSMEPTLLPHDRVLVDKFLYRLRQPHRGDVVVLKYPLNPQRNYIKRIVALPGDKLEVKDGKVHINGTPSQEPYVNGTPQGDFGPITVPADSVFVMGDNRNNSEDSRSFGALKEEQIVGQAILIYWPPQRIRLLLAR